MHNIKDIRNNFENFKNIIKLRNISIDFEEILNLPTNICRAYKIARMKISLKKCLSDIQVMQQELKNYEN